MMMFAFGFAVALIVMNLLDYWVRWYGIDD